MMNIQKIFVLFLVLSGLSIVYAAGLTLYGADHFYQYHDQIDSTKSKSSHYLDLGVALDDIGGSGLSFHSDLLYADKGLTYFDSATAMRKQLRIQPQITTGYLDWQSEQRKVDVRLGRQIYNNLAIETFDIDGLRVAVSPSAATSFNLGGGLVVPTPYNTKNLMSSAAGGSIILVDISNRSIPLTTLNGAFAIEKSLHGASSTRIALGTMINPAEFLQIDGSGRFSTAVSGLDHLDLNLTITSSKSLYTRLFFISERDRVDSLNYFTIMLHEQLTELGFRLDYYPDGGGCVQGGYHTTTIKGEGADHFFLVNAANKVLEGGAVFGVGFHGLTLRPHGGISLPLGKYVFVKGTGEYQYTRENDDDGSHQSIVAAVGLKGAFYPIGLTIYPRVEYISNRYYTKDLRLLITTSFLLHKFWGGGK